MFKKILLFAIMLLLFQIAWGEEILLAPSGKYGVGFQDFHMVNGAMINGPYHCPGKTDLLYIKNQNEKDFGKDNQIDFCREIMLRIYYPIDSKSLSRENYYPPAIHHSQNLLRALHIPGVTEEQILDLANLKTFTANFTNKEPNIAATKFPVLIFDPGSGWEAQEYENIITEMVSQGYIVVAINNTFIGSEILFPDGRIVEYADVPDKLGDQSVLNDILFVRQQLNTANDVALLKLISHMHLDQIGLFGHSMGGISSVQAARAYSDLFQAAMSLDSPPVGFGTRAYSEQELAGFKIPFMRMFAASWRSFFDIPKDAKFELLKDNYYTLLSPSEDNISYTAHMSLSDCSTLQYQQLLKYLIPQEAVGTADGWHMARLINTYILEFFNQYLKGIPSWHLATCQSIANDTALTCSASITSNNSGESNSNAVAIGVATGSIAALAGAAYLGSSQ